MEIKNAHLIPIFFIMLAARTKAGDEKNPNTTACGKSMGVEIKAFRSKKLHVILILSHSLSSQALMHV